MVKRQQLITGDNKYYYYDTIVTSIISINAIQTEIKKENYRKIIKGMYCGEVVHVWCANNSKENKRK